MIHVRPFRAVDLDAIEPQPGQRVELVTRARACELERVWSFTVLDEQQRVLMCAGAFPAADDTWWGWALLSVLARRRMLALTRAVLGVMPAMPAARVRIGVRWGFREGHVWATMLGFTALPELHRLGGVWCGIYERGLSSGP